MTSKYHLVRIQPGPSLEAHVKLVKWPKARGVPDADDPSRPWTRQLTGKGMLCTVEDCDLEEARTLGEVEVLMTKELEDEPASPSADSWVDVSLNGIPLSVEESTLRPGGKGPLAPRSHIVDGELSAADCFGSDSYAHVAKDGTIRRYHEVIGKREDIVRDATKEDG